MSNLDSSDDDDILSDFDSEILSKHEKSNSKDGYRQSIADVDLSK